MKGRPEEAALVDDREPNVAGARSLGIDAYRIVRTPEADAGSGHLINNLWDLPFLRDERAPKREFQS